MKNSPHRVILCGMRNLNARLLPARALIRALIVVLIGGVGLTACTPPMTSPTPTAIPGAVSRNADWRPVIQTIDGVEMVKVPAGCFTMGSPDGRRDERPPTRVCIERPFWLDRTEVTNAQYQLEGPYPGPDRPRTNLTWAEARDHCRVRGGRLPTEAEWEFAGRGPDGLYYPWGNILVEDRLNYDKRQLEPSPVGSFPNGQSWVGAHDLSGNVWEWVNSQYRPYPYNAADGRESLTDLSVPRVFRGGWLSYVDRATSVVMRFRTAPDGRDWRIGFRCARDVGEGE